MPWGVLTGVLEVRAGESPGGPIGRTIPSGFRGGILAPKPLPTLAIHTQEG